MIAGSDAKRLFAVGAICCAIFGLVLAAGVMPILASESPGQEYVSERMESPNAPDRPAEGWEDRDTDTAGATGGEGNAEGIHRTETSGSAETPGVALEGGDQPVDSPLVGGVLYGLASLLSALGNGSGGEQLGERATESGSMLGGFDIDLGGAFGTALSSSGDSSPKMADDASNDRERDDQRSAESASSASGEPDDSEDSSADTGDGTAGTDTDDGADTGDETGNTDEASLRDAASELSDDSTTPAVLAALALLVAGYAVATRTNPISVALAIPGRLVSAVLTAVVACSRALERALTAVRGLRSIADLPGLVLAAIADVFRSTRARVDALQASIPRFGREDPVEREADDEPSAARDRIRLAFESVVDASAMYRSRVATATPTDVADSATNAGAPEGSVTTITDSFRDVEYGARDPEQYLEATTDAHERLRADLEAAEETEADDE